MAGEGKDPSEGRQGTGWLQASQHPAQGWPSPHWDPAQRQQTHTGGTCADETCTSHTCPARCSHTALRNTNLGKTRFPASPLPFPFSFSPHGGSANPEPAQHQPGVLSSQLALVCTALQDQPPRHLCLCLCLGATVAGRSGGELQTRGGVSSNDKTTSGERKGKCLQ